MGISLENLSAEERLLVSLCSASAPLSMASGVRRAESGERGAQSTEHRSQSEEQEAENEIEELIKRVTDWEGFVRLANEHGVIALVAYNIGVTALRRYGVTGKGRKTLDEGHRDAETKGRRDAETQTSSVPEGVMKALENGLMQSIVRNTWLAERWREVNKILGGAGIKHILLKGMALEHTLYGSRGLRQMNDNDILLKREESLKAWHLLQKNGFTIEPVKSRLHRKIMIDIGKHLPTLYKDGYAVEIHHRLLNSSTEEKESDYFEDAEEIIVGDTKALILSKKNQLKHLISHYKTHAAEGSCQLRLYTDIMLLDKTNELVMPEHFIKNPQQEMTMKHKRASYRATLRSVPARYRLRFIIGDLFPSLEWMKKRHGCGSFKTLFYYPRRIGKLEWLV